MSYQNKYLALFNELRNSQHQDDQHLNSRVLIVDGMNTFIRSYTASPATNEDGVHVGGISGTLLSIGHAIKAINPTRVVVVFDGKNGSVRRRQLYSDYKANRKVKVRLNRAETVDSQDNQLQQLLRLTEYLSILPFTTIVVENVEADDVIAYVANDYLKVNGDQVYIMSSDKDFYQLVNQSIHVWSPTKKKLYYTEDVYAEYGIHPTNFVLYRALLGDTSDNINGVSGIGDKTIKKRFSILNEQSTITTQQLLEYANTNKGKIKIYQTLLDEQEILNRNLQLMQLHDVDISGSTKLKIIDKMNESPKPIAQVQFYRMLREDKMMAAIKNVDMWVREITMKLNRFALQNPE